MVRAASAWVGIWLIAAGTGLIVVGMRLIVVGTYAGSAWTSLAACAEYLANARVTGSGSQPPVGWTTPVSASTTQAVGRSRGSAARQRSTSGRTSAGTRSRAAWPLTRRWTSVMFEPVPNGPSPVAAKVRTAPRLKMSLAGPTWRPSACSGDMKPGEPTTRPVRVSAPPSPPREMPKSITRGPSLASSTFDGFRSRCTTPAAWIALRPSARPAASCSTEPAGSGPCSATASASEGPDT